ncbi:MAG: glycosyltransferase family 1 protein [Agriterribacter sp.]
MIKVVFFQRKPLPIHKSIEFIFEDVRQRLAGRIFSVKKVFSFYSKGIVDRLQIMVEAYKNQGDINHITGDVHFAAILLNKKKTILTIHDCGMLASSSGIKHFLFKFFWFTYPLKKCNLVTVVSETTKKELIKYTNCSSDKIHVIPVAVSSLFVYEPKPFNHIKPVILQFCTTPNKNTERVIVALKGIACDLLIIGKLTSSQKELLKQTNINYKNVENISEKELVEHYKSSDMLSFVSTYEGFGMPIIEAQATGRPVITSNISSMPEIAGKAACLVNPYNIDEIRNGILKIINDTAYRQELINEGLKNCRRFEGDTIANEYLQLYKTMTGIDK